MITFADDVKSLLDLEFEGILRSLKLMNQKISFLTIKQVSRLTKVELERSIHKAQYHGERVSASWSKSALVEAYIALHRERLIDQKQRLERRLAEILGWPEDEII